MAVLAPAHLDHRHYSPELSLDLDVPLDDDFVGDERHVLRCKPTFREDFRESLYRLVGTLTATGVTVFMTAEVSEAFREARFTSENVSFITDEIIVQRYVEIEGALGRVMAVMNTVTPVAVSVPPRR